MTPNPTYVVLAWIFTICCAGGVVINIWLATRPPHVLHPVRSIVWGVLLVAGAIWIWLASRTKNVSPDG